MPIHYDRVEQSNKPLAFSLLLGLIEFFIARRRCLHNLPDRSLDDRFILEYPEIFQTNRESSANAQDIAA